MDVTEICQYIAWKTNNHDAQDKTKTTKLGIIIYVMKVHNLFVVSVEQNIQEMKSRIIQCNSKSVSIERRQILMSLPVNLCQDDDDYNFDEQKYKITPNPSSSGNCNIK